MATDSRKIIETLENLLVSTKKYQVEGSVNKNLVAADARKYDEALIGLLAGEASLRKHFFSETKYGLVFKKDIFLQFIMNKEFLPDSYTKYKIKIGLGAEDGSLLSESGDVVLNWPYKDAILEGGQDKEDQKRSEVFFNKVLAPDQITRLLDDKVFTNWKRYDKDGEHQLDELKDDDNLIIKGNNLVVLHSLKKRYAGKVKLIYIDPPFNTGSDGFNYNDRFNHSTWLTFMKNRLAVAKELLSDEGSILIHCDENENAYVRVLADEIFGRDKFVNEIIWHYKSFSGQVRSYFPKKHDTMLLYKKGDTFTFNQVRKDIPIEEMSDFKNWGKYIVNGNEIRGHHYPTDVRFKRNLDKWKRDNDDANPTKNDVLYVFQSQPVDDVWDIDYLDPKNKSERTEFSGGQKPEALIRRILQSLTNKGDLVLDYHLGSGTSCAVAHKMKRRWIGIEQMDYINSLTITRLNKVIEGEQGGISKEEVWQGGGSFVYANIMNNSNKFRKRVEAAKNDSDFLALLQEATSSSFLSYRVDPKKLNEEEFRKLSAAEKRRLLLELIDSNTLYVNYEDINDPIFKVSEKDKKLNASFYNASEKEL